MIVKIDNFSGDRRPPARASWRSVCISLRKWIQMVRSSEVVKIKLESYPVSLWHTDMTDMTGSNIASDCCVELKSLHSSFTCFCSWVYRRSGNVVWLLGGRNLISQLCRIRWGWSLDFAWMTSICQMHPYASMACHIPLIFYWSVS